MRKGTAWDTKLATFLMCGGVRFYFAVGSQLGIERSFALLLIRVAGNELCEFYLDLIRLHRSNADVFRTMKGFEDMSGQNYCGSAFDVCHILVL